MKLPDTQLSLTAVYVLTVREFLGKELASMGVIGYQEKADRLMVNEIFEVLVKHKDGMIAEDTAKYLTGMLPASWSRKKKKAPTTVNQA
jgi:hypothetical protein